MKQSGPHMVQLFTVRVVLCSSTLSSQSDTFRVMRRNYPHDFPVNSLAAAADDDNARVVFKRRALTARDGKVMRSAAPSQIPKLPNPTLPAAPTSKTIFPTV